MMNRVDRPAYWSSYGNCEQARDFAGHEDLAAGAVISCARGGARLNVTVLVVESRRRQRRFETRAGHLHRRLPQEIRRSSSLPESLRSRRDGHRGRSSPARSAWVSSRMNGLIVGLIIGRATDLGWATEREWRCSSCILLLRWVPKLGSRSSTLSVGASALTSWRRPPPGQLRADRKRRELLVRDQCSRLHPQDLIGDGMHHRNGAAK